MHGYQTRPLESLPLPEPGRGGRQKNRGPIAC
jgi:hypothetical protein